MWRKRFVCLAVLAVAGPVVQTAEAAEPAHKGAIVMRGGISLKVITVKDTKAREAPQDDAKGNSLPAFTILYVLPPRDDAEDRRVEAIGYENRKAKGYFRVAATSDEKTYVGFVHETDVVEWTHREAVTFMPPTERRRALFYDSEESATKDYQGTADPELAIATEPASMGRAFVLLPILDSRPLVVRGHEVLLHKVAFMASSSSPAATAPVKTRSGVVVDEQYVRKNSTADVVFVIDTTSSMKPPIDQVKKSVARVVEKLRSEASKGLKVAVRFGLVAFRDVDQARVEGSYVTKTFCTLVEGAEPGVFEQRLASLSPGGGGNLAEEVLGGLKDAMSESMGWNEVGWKQVILVGDASGRERDHPVEDSRTNRDGLLLEDVKRMAQPDLDGRAETLMRVYTLHAVHTWHTHDHYSKDNTVAYRQFRELSRGARRPDARGFFVSAKGGDEPEDFSEKLTDYLVRSLHLFEKHVRKGEALPAPALAPRDPESASGVDAIAAAPAMPYPILELLRALPGSAREAPKFFQGWTPERDAKGQKVLVPHVLVTRGELDTFVSGLNFLLSSLEARSNSGADKSLEKIVDQLKLLTAAATTGEQLSADTQFDKFFGGLLGVPIQSKIFNMNLTRLIAMSEGGYADWLRTARDSARQIQAVLARPEAWVYLVEMEGVARKESHKHAFIPLTDMP